MIETKVRDLLQNIKEEMAKPTAGIPITRNNPPGQALPLAEAISDRLLKNLHLEEKRKYPSPPYTYQTKNLEAVKGKRVVYVTYDGTKPTAANLDTTQVHSHVVRRLSILGGILHGLQFSDSFLSIDQDKRDEICKFINDQITLAMNISRSGDVSSAQNIDIENFIASLGQKIGEITNEDKNRVTNKIRRVECYFVAEYRSPILINETKLDGQTTAVSMDVSLGNPLSVAQRQEFHRIHSDDNQPTWFTRLSFWEQNWFEKQIPKNLNDNEAWKKFESISQTSGMTHIPGLQNARMHYLLKSKNNGPYRLLGSNIKNGSLDPYDMPSDERLKHVKDNGEQVLHILTEHANENFHDQWGNIFDGTKIKPFILVQSLLSDTSFNALDVRLVNEQIQGVQDAYYQHAHDPAHPFNQVNLIVDNAPVNVMRLVSAEVGTISQAVGRWDGTDNIINAAKEMIAAVRDKEGAVTLSKEQLDKLDFMQKMCKELENIRNSAAFTHMFSDQNITAIKAAYSQLLVEAMGGAVATNCKSGKDRTGLDEALRDALLLYYDEHGEIPSFNETNDNYLSTFVKLYDSMKIHEAGAMNTPGSFGINDRARMLHVAARDKLGDSYLAGIYRSLWNKLGFTSHESKDAKQLKLEEKKGFYLSTRDEYMKLNVFLNDVSRQLSDNSVKDKKYKDFAKFHQDIISRDLTQLSAAEMKGLHQEVRTKYDKTFTSPNISRRMTETEKATTSTNMPEQMAETKKASSSFLRKAFGGERKGIQPKSATTASLSKTTSSISEPTVESPKPRSGFFGKH